MPWYIWVSKLKQGLIKKTSNMYYNKKLKKLKKWSSNGLKNKYFKKWEVKLHWRIFTEKINLTNMLECYRMVNFIESLVLISIYGWNFHLLLHSNYWRSAHICIVQFKDVLEAISHILKNSMSCWYGLDMEKY